MRERERSGVRRGALFPSSSSYGRASDVLKRGGRAREPPQQQQWQPRMLLCFCLRAKGIVCVCVCVCLVRQVRDGSPNGSNFCDRCPVPRRRFGRRRTTRRWKRSASSTSICGRPNENHALQVQTVILFFGGGATSAICVPRVTRMLDHLRTVGGTLPICGKSSSVTRGFLDEDGN